MRNEEWKHDELILVLIMKDVPGTHIYLNLHFSQELLQYTVYVNNNMWVLETKF